MKRVVVSLGESVFSSSNFKNIAKYLVDLIEKDISLVITYDNNKNNLEGDSDLDIVQMKAMSQGYIGYQLQQEIKDELDKKNINKNIVTVVTQVLVSDKDLSFSKPTKTIGDYYTKKEATALEKKYKYKFKKEENGYRRLIPTPDPIEILEIDTINSLLNNNTIVIAGGGGGIPVIKTKKEGYEGVDAIVDKDIASSLLASKINADQLLILTSVEKISLNYNKPNERKLDRLSLTDALFYSKKNHFGINNMNPKIEAAIKFVKDTNNKAIITNLPSIVDAYLGKTGTTIYDKKVENVNLNSKRLSFSLSAFTIMLLLIFLLAGLTNFLPEAEQIIDIDGNFQGIVNGSGVIRTNLSNTLLAPIKGFTETIDIALFLLILGAFLKIVEKTKAIEVGIQGLIKKFKGNELVLIPVLMIIFSIGGTTYGMLEETIGFYAMLAFAMVAAGMDTIVSSSIIILGAGSGVLGSTINPFAVGVAIDSAKKVLPPGVEINQGVIIGLGFVLWISTLIISIYFVMNYARGLIAKKGSTFLSLQEQKDMEEYYGEINNKTKENKLSIKQKTTLFLFFFTFIVMIISFIPWQDFGITLLNDNSFLSLEWLVGKPLGKWYFQEATLWFLIMTIIIAVVNRFKEKDTVYTFIDGADDMVGVVLILTIARGAAILIRTTYLDNYIFYNLIELLGNMSPVIFAPFNYLIHISLSVLIPSSSALASLSTPIMVSLANNLDYNIESTIMQMISANGLVNLFIPTCGTIMAGLAISRVDYGTWIRWVGKILLVIALVNMIIFTVFALINS